MAPVLSDRQTVDLMAGTVEPQSSAIQLVEAEESILMMEVSAVVEVRVLGLVLEEQELMTLLMVFQGMVVQVVQEMVEEDEKQEEEVLVNPERMEMTPMVVLLMEIVIFFHLLEVLVEEVEVLMIVVVMKKELVVEAVVEVPS